MIFKIAFRNVFRNARRSTATILTIAVGTAATLIFLAYTLYNVLGLQTSTVDRGGHLTIFRNGFYDFGAGNPAVWGIDDYQTVLKLVRTDPVLAPMIAVVTPVQQVGGIASNADSDVSKTFFGQGFIPSERDAMKRWNEYGTGGVSVGDTGLKDDDPSQGVIGSGLALILGLCKPLHFDYCPKLPKGAPKELDQSPSAANLPSQDFSALSGRDVAAQQSATGLPSLDILAATAGGAPNVVRLKILRVEYQGVKALDDSYIGMHLALAQQLVYGRGEHKVTGIVVQLHRTEDWQFAKQRMLELFAKNNLNLEIKNYAELNPFYVQALQFLYSIFLFIAVIFGVVVLFTVSNAMSMSVVERTDEIGTLRALGLRRAKIRRQFITEGFLLGVIGTTLGVIAALAIAALINRSGLTWTPPGQTYSVPLKLYLFGATQSIVVIWIILVVVSTLASLLPANRAAKMQIVDALRHV